MKFASVDEETADLLALVAYDADYARFITICKTVADNNGGIISVQAVRDVIREQGIDIPARRYSSFWSRACRKGGPMVATHDWDLCTDKDGKNSGKPQRKRRWVA